MNESIEWCRQNIKPRFPNFTFRCVDVMNPQYNEGSIRAADFTFPYEDAFFDFVFLASVFTHMRPADMQRYAHEIARVLKPKGRCLITAFLLHAESRSNALSGRAIFPFTAVPGEVYAVFDPNKHEHAIAYSEDFVREVLSRNNLQIREPIHYGTWFGRKRGLTVQDIIITQKI